MKKVINESTGIEEIQFGGKLVSISEKVLTNVNGKNYKVATIDFEDTTGKDQRCTALVYEGNYNHESIKEKGLIIGEKYACTATPADGNVFVKMSHLLYSGDRASAEMFDFATITTAVKEMAPNKEFEHDV